jgi:hypothetical protein
MHTVYLNSFFLSYMFKCNLPQRRMRRLWIGLYILQFTKWMHSSPSHTFCILYISYSYLYSLYIYYSYSDTNFENRYWNSSQRRIIRNLINYFSHSMQLKCQIKIYCCPVYCTCSTFNLTLCWILKFRQCVFVYTEGCKMQ